MIGHSLKIIFDTVGFAYDFAFSQNKWSLKTFQNVLWKMSFKNAKVYQSVWGGGSKKNIKNNMGLVDQNLRNVRSSRKSRYEKILCFNDVPIYFLILFEVFLYNQSHKYGAPGLGKSRNHEIWRF